MGILFLIGLGLGDHKDITLRGLEAVKRCGDNVFLDMYTSVLGVDTVKLEEAFGCKITVADREMVESQSDRIIAGARGDGCSSFLVVGDPFGATTHTDLALRAREEGIVVEVVHNASIMNAVGCCGLQLYNFGQTVSIPYFTANWKPFSFIDKLLFNKKHELHTLCLLDIKVKEVSEENMMKGKMIYDPPRFMSVNVALEQMVQAMDARPDDCAGILSRDTQVVGLARIGQPTQQIVYGTIDELLTVDFSTPLHSLIVPGNCHELELEYLAGFHVGTRTDVRVGAGVGAGASASQ